MKEKFKNFIAFTLSEMMIVLLIFSVLTAATLPAITTRKENSNPNISSGSGGEASSIWEEESYTNGIFYDYYTKSNPKEVVINSSSSINTGMMSTTTGLQDISAAVFLTSKNNDETSSTYNHLNVKNNSTIEFIAGGSNSGRIALDHLPSVYIGVDNTLNPNVTASLNAYSTLVGHFLGGSPVTAYGSTMIGTDTGNSVTGGLATDEKSVFIGNNIPLYQYSTRQVVIDPDSTANNSTFAGASYSNVLVGQNVAYNLRPTNSVVIGTQAGYFPSSFSTNNSVYDVIIGRYAGYVNRMQTSYSVIVGNYAGAYKTSVSSGRVGDVIIGTKAFSHGQYDVAIGTYAGHILSMATSGLTNSVKIGSYAGYNARTASDSVMIGSHAGSYSGTMWGVNQAVFIGKYAGSYYAGASASSSSKAPVGSVALGEYALSSQYSYTDSGKNVCIGKRACKNANTKLLYTTAIGTDVVGAVNNGSETYEKALLIGSGCYSSSGGTNWSNSICIANGAKVPGISVSYSMGTYSLWVDRNTKYDGKAHTIIAPSFDGSSASYLNSSIVLYAGKVYGGSSLRVYSDKRLKENIVPVKSSLDKVRKINVYQYNMKKETPKDVKIGVMAQELKEIYPQAVSMFNNYLTVNSDWVFYSTIRAIKDLDGIVQKVQKELDLAKHNFNNLLVRVNKLEVRMNNISNSNKTLILKLNEIEQAKKMERK